MNKYIITLILIIKIKTDIQSLEECLEYFYENYQTPKSEFLYLYEILTYLTTSNNEEYLKIFMSDQLYSKLFYTKSNKISFKNYTYFFLNSDNYNIKIVIQPCENLKQNCCDNLSQCPTENTNVIGKKDLEVAYIINNFLPFCTGDFENFCGTFLEIHTPGSEIILQEIQISKTFSSGFQTLFLSTKKLCAGKYEIWMVMRMRGVNYLMVVKPFYVKYPSCTCEEILNHGFSC
jgi:hypothetical protein